MGNRRFLKRILATYLCIMIIPMVCGAVIYQYILSKNTERVIAVLENSFENNIDGITADLNMMESTAESIALNPEFSKFFYDYLTGSGITTNELLGFRKLLNSYRFDGKITDTVFIYSKHLDTLIHFNNIYQDPVNFFKDHYRVESENYAETLSRLVNGNKERFVSKVKIENEYVKYPVIEFQKPVPIMGPRADGYITVFIKSDELFSSFGKIIEESNGSMNVFYDEYPIYSSGNANNKGNMHTFSLSPENSKWRYELYIPDNYVMKDTRTMNMVLLLVNAATFIIGSLLCVYFAMKKVRAYEDIILKMDLVGSDFKTGRGDEIEKIGEFINELMKNKDETEQELLEQKRIGNTYECIHNLLYRGYESHEEAQFAINENGVVLGGNKYAVLLLSFASGVKNISDEIGIKSLVQTSLAEFMGDMVYTYYIDSYNIAAVVSFDGSEEEFASYLKNIVSSMRVDLVYRYNIGIHIGVGEITTKLNEISLSLDGANEVVNYVKMIGEDKFVLHSDLPQNGDGCYYNTEIEENLIRCVHAGDGEKAATILKGVKEKNLTERTLSPTDVKKLATRIETTMIKINEKADGETGFSFERKSLPELFDYAAEYMKIVASSLTAPTEKRSDVLHNEIVEYVKKNYADSELSLEKLSARFNLNVAYTSTVFRKKTGDTFLHYVERLRINKACELILTSGYKISAIAGEVGYTNDTSFRRSFKRITGVSPSQYYSENIKK